MKAVISIAARMASSRLPGKVMADIDGLPVLHRIIARLFKAKAEIVVANNGMDPELRDFAGRMGVGYVGLPVDVLGIHYAAMVAADADVLLLAGADDPLLDPTLFDLVLDRMAVGDVDYCRTSGWPLGANVWGMTRAALDDAQRLATAPDERQHVVPFCERRPRTYRKVVLNRFEDVYDMRVTLDNPSDLELTREIYRRLPWDCSVEQVIALLEAEPELRRMNADGLQGTAARDAIYPDLRPVDGLPDPLIEDIRYHVAVSQAAAEGSIGEYGDFARGQAAGLLSLSQWLDYRAAR